jgi:hypothetical protein
MFSNHRDLRDSRLRREELRLGVSKDISFRMGHNSKDSMGRYQGCVSGYLTIAEFMSNMQMGGMMGGQSNPVGFINIQGIMNDV